MDVFIFYTPIYEVVHYKRCKKDTLRLLLIYYISAKANLQLIFQNILCIISFLEIKYFKNSKYKFYEINFEFLQMYSFNELSLNI